MVDKVWVILFDDLEYGVLGPGYYVNHVYGTREKAEAALLPYKQEDVDKNLEFRARECKFNNQRMILELMRFYFGPPLFPEPTIETINCDFYIEEREVQ